MTTPDEPVFVERTRGEVSALASHHHPTVLKLRTAKEVADHFGFKLEFHDHHLVVVDNSKPKSVMFLPHFCSERVDRHHALEAVGMKMMHPELRHINDDTVHKVREEGMWWAIGAIMPRTSFEWAADNYRGSALQMAEYFYVTEQAVRARAKSLHLQHLIVDNTKASKPKA